MGLTDTQPKQRPYPLSVIESIITQVCEHGDEQEASIARGYEKSLLQKPVTLTFGSGWQNGATITFGGFGDVALTDALSLSYDILDVVSNGDISTAPRYTGLPYDAPDDPAKFGSMDAVFQSNIVFSFGKPDLYITTGTGRTAFGNDLYDSLVLSPYSLHAPYATIYAAAGPLTVTQGIQCLTATDGNRKETDEQKFLSYHEVTWHMWSWFTLSWFESAVYGGQFDLKYLFPSMFITAESFGGFNGSILMGMGGKITYFPNLVLFGDIFIDDISVNDVVKLNLDTKIVGAGMIGAQYSPKNQAVRLVSGTYTLVTPWMYAHYDGNAKATDPNVQNYAHFGDNKATQLPPNSHRLAVTAELQPTSKWKTTLSLAISQHGNISESLTEKEAQQYLNDPYITDGSIHNSPVYFNNTTQDTEFQDSYFDHFQFLQQKTIETMMQLSAGTTYTCIDRNHISLALKAGYTFEYIHNKGVDENIYLNNGKTVQEQLSDWRAAIIPHTVNNYLTLGFVLNY